MKLSRLKNERLVDVYEKIFSLLTTLGTIILSLLLWYGLFKLLSVMM